MLDNKVKMVNLINDIRVHSAILIMGAGASFESGLPLYAQFAPIVWQVVDEFDDIKESIKCNITIPAKNIIGNDTEKIKQSFIYIEENYLANVRFKELFKAINDKHKNGHLLVHENICKLIHAGYIKLVISFNWDDLLETAWEGLYGTNINESKINLLKPHGDVRNLSYKWTYPNSAGFLSTDDISKIRSVTEEGPLTFAILGYSEQDRIITDTFIRPNENKYVVYRISPSAYGDNAISAKASEVMQEIFDNFNERVDNSWVRLDFSNQVGLEHAIMGHRLLPSDVSACPRLPQIKEAKIRLEQAHCVIIEGEPGSGKSITAYQIAWDYQQKGWETLRLNISKLDGHKNNNIMLVNNGYKTIFIIDDAQQIDREQIIELMTKANRDNKLIITQTITSNFPSESITISQRQAVETLFEYYMQHKTEVLPIIQSLNKIAHRSVGDNPMDTPFDFVLDVALKENTPWLFNYSLRGGWESTSNQYAAAKEHNRADILLTFIALKQILTLDKPVDKTWLNSQLQRWGYTEQWISEQMDYLYKQKLIINLDEIRTLHLQMAIRIIANYLKQVHNNEGSRFYSFLQQELLTNNPLLGIVWFFNLLFSFDIKYKIKFNIFTDEFNKKLMHRCSQQTESKYKSHAGIIIDRVLHLEAGLQYRDIVEDNNFLVHWIENADNETAYSFSQILNSMINESRDWQKDFVSSLNGQSIIENMRKIKNKYLYDWASFLNRLLFSRKAEWSKIFCYQLPKQEISNEMQRCTTKNIGGLSEFLCSLKIIDEVFCFEEYHKCIWIIEKSMKEEFVRTLENLDIHFLMYLLGENLFDLGRPNQKQKDAGKAFVECITADMIRKCIFEGIPRNWDTLYRFSGEILRYDSQKFMDAIRDVDFNILNSKVADMWEEQSDVLIELLYMLYSSDEVKTEEWIYANRDNIKDIDSALTQFSPRTAEYVYNNGRTVLLTKSHRWGINANAILCLKKYNRNLCYKIVNENLADVKQSVYDLANIDWDEYHLYLKQLLKINKNIIDIIINDMDVLLIEEKWKSILKGEFYKHQKKDLQGFYKVIIMVKENTINLLIVESMVRISEKLETTLKNLKSF